MKIYIFTDLEGVSGVCVFAQTRDEGPRYEEARRLLMLDIRACVDGLLEGGADEIIVRDGHGKPYNFVPELMHPGARYVVGRFAGLPLGGGLDADCDGIILLGHHAMAGTDDGILCHTQSSKPGNRYWYNGRESGEMAQEALIAGHYGIPLIMVSGDDAACREARGFFGDGPVCVSVKTGLGRETGILLAPEEAHRRIREGAKEAIRRVPRCKPYTTDLPIRARLERFDETSSRWVTVEKTFETALDILRF